MSSDVSDSYFEDSEICGLSGLRNVGRSEAIPDEPDFKLCQVEPVDVESGSLYSSVEDIGDACDESVLRIEVPLYDGGGFHPQIRLTTANESTRQAPVGHEDISAKEAEDSAKEQYTAMPAERPIMCYMRERDQARSEATKARSDLNAAQIKLYDMQMKMERLEKQLKECGLSKKKKAPVQVKQDALKQPTTTSSLRTPTPTSSLKSPTSPRKSPTSSRKCPPPSRKPPPSPRKKKPRSQKTDLKYDEKLADQTEQFPNSTVYSSYKEIAEQFPHMPLSTVLDAQERFKAADVNGDGTIDREELDNVLMSNNFLLTPHQIDGILEEVDRDKNQSADFQEVLTILNKFDRFNRFRRQSPVPTEIREKRSQICAIQ